MITEYNRIGGSRIAYLAAMDIIKRKQNEELNEPLRSSLFVVTTDNEASALAEDISFFLPDAEITVLFDNEKANFSFDAQDRNNVDARLKAMKSLALNLDKDDIKIVVATVASAFQTTVSAKKFIENTISLRLGEERDPNYIKTKLVALGYEAVDVAESPGEFASRGGIIDVFVPGDENPVRIELFGDEIDSLRQYDFETQRSITNLTEITICQAEEFIPNEEEVKKFLHDIKNQKIKLPTEKFDISNEFSAEEYNYRVFGEYIDYLDIEKSSIAEYLMNENHTDSSGFLYIISPSLFEGKLSEDLADIVKNKLRSIIQIVDTKIYEHFSDKTTVLAESEENKYQHEIKNVSSRRLESFNGQIDLFAESIKSLIKKGYAIHIISSSEERNERINEYLQIADVVGNIEYHVGHISSGFVVDDDMVCYVTEGDIFPQLRRSRPIKKKKGSSDKSLNMLTFSEFKEGDYVVHESYGIGRFEGIKEMTFSGKTGDYMVISYAESNILYLPVDQLYAVQRYVGSGNATPKLSRMSGSSWKKTKERARKAIMEIAEDLIKLYAERESSGGYAFGEDTVWQRQFEDDFPFVETDDQLTASEEIKQDMQKPVPMDRLLCGDVGYGKTEVAARAVFKCLSEGKQAALLAPTTLLVNQHYRNMLERFSGFPFEIAELSRFKKTSEVKQIKEGLKDGSVDFVIGTHRLLSKDINFKDLGLLVVDEEQRFGVQHKEKIKKIKHNVDVLTLSATPIPRTLNMSLVGIKNISTIDQPPGERYPVRTYVAAYDDDMIAEAIKKELSRGGQVFIVNNRITGLKQIAEHIKTLVPDVRIVTAHGRMNEDTLENIVLDFAGGKTDVLVATTIIENGIDIPNANTIIVLNSDRFGLSQLYQLRGRVGRSDRVAYSYFTYQPQKLISEIARKRLSAIKDFTEFGSGFKVAMRDLELRGAGNILGEAQSGHIEGIGFELYCKEVDRAVRMLQGENVQEIKSETSIDIPYKALIPSKYIYNETLRLRAYRKISDIHKEADFDDIQDELIDMYGDMPQEVINLMMVAEIRAHSENLGVKLIKMNKRIIRIEFEDKNNLNPYAVVMANEKFQNSLNISMGKKTVLNLVVSKPKEPSELLKLMRILDE